MTAQIGVINKKCVALATDSAVTMSNGGNHKAFNTADKLFQLAKHIPVGIMIYNNAEFLGVPWEIIIKQYRNHIKDTKYDVLADYCNDFFEFVTSLDIFTEECKLNNVLQIAYNHLDNVLKKISDTLIGPMDEVSVKESMLEFFYSYETYIEQQRNTYSDEATYYEWISKCDNHLKKILLDSINNEELRFTDDELNSIINCLKKAVLSNEYTNIKTGIVLAGYGEKECFPRLYEFEIEGVIDNSLKIKELKTVEVGIGHNEESAAIATFAQAEMAYSFLRGIHPELQQDILDAVEELCVPLTDRFNETIFHNNLELEIEDGMQGLIDVVGESIFKTIEEFIEQRQDSKYTDPFLLMVQSLDKLQMADLAESLVSLTSFKRKMTMDTETVGGPIDVAVISKGDGFIWIKRKHYFKADLNPNYKNKN